MFVYVQRTLPKPTGNTIRSPSRCPGRPPPASANVAGPGRKACAGSARTAPRTAHRFLLDHVRRRLRTSLWRILAQIGRARSIRSAGTSGRVSSQALGSSTVDGRASCRRDVLALEQVQACSRGFSNRRSWTPTQEAVEYNTMDHSAVNRVFVDDLLRLVNAGTPRPRRRHGHCSHSDRAL